MALRGAGRAESAREAGSGRTPSRRPPGPTRARSSPDGHCDAPPDQTIHDSGHMTPLAGKPARGKMHRSGDQGKMSDGHRPVQQALGERRRLAGIHTTHCRTESSQEQYKAAHRVNGTERGDENGGSHDQEPTRDIPPKSAGPQSNHNCRLDPGRRVEPGHIIHHLCRKGSNGNDWRALSLATSPAVCACHCGTAVLADGLGGVLDRETLVGLDRGHGSDRVRRGPESAASLCRASE
jgi:hypothetical protein